MESNNQKEKLTTLMLELLQLVIVNNSKSINIYLYKNLSFLNDEIVNKLDYNNHSKQLYNLIYQGKNKVDDIQKEWHDYKKTLNGQIIVTDENQTIEYTSDSFISSVVLNFKKFESSLENIKEILNQEESKLIPSVIYELTTKIHVLEAMQENTTNIVSNEESKFNVKISNYKKDFNYYSKLNAESYEKLTSELIKIANDSELSLGRKVPELTEAIKKELAFTIIEKSNEIELLRKTVKADEIAFRSLFEEMKKLYKIAGDGKLSDQNIKQADEEKTAADKMRLFGVGLLFVLIGFAAWFLVLLTELPANTSYLSWFLPRFLTLTFCSMPAIYLLKESASHRHKENLYRQRGTQLATLGSYLADFNNDDKRMDVKSELIKNFYSFNDGKADTSNVPDFLKQMKEFAAVTKTFNKMAPAEQPQPQQAQNTPVTPIHEASNADDKKKAG